MLLLSVGWGEGGGGCPWETEVGKADGEVGLPSSFPSPLPVPPQKTGGAGWNVSAVAGIMVWVAGVVTVPSCPGVAGWPSLASTVAGVCWEQHRFL